MRTGKSGTAAADSWKNPRPFPADGNRLNTGPIVVIDHAGKNGLDAAAYFMGHGLQNARCLRGGIDAWAQEVDVTMRRFKLK